MIKLLNRKWLSENIDKLNGKEITIAILKGSRWNEYMILKKLIIVSTKVEFIGSTVYLRYIINLTDDYTLIITDSQYRISHKSRNIRAKLIDTDYYPNDIPEIC